MCPYQLDSPREKQFLVSKPNISHDKGKQQWENSKADHSLSKNLYLAWFPLTFLPLDATILQIYQMLVLPLLFGAFISDSKYITVIVKENYLEALKSNGSVFGTSLFGHAQVIHLNSWPHSWTLLGNFWIELPLALLSNVGFISPCPIILFNNAVCSV